MSPSPRAAALLAVAAVLALLIPSRLAILLAVAVLGAVIADALAAGRKAKIKRKVPRILSRGVGSPVAIDVSGLSLGSSVRVRQPTVPDVSVDPQEGGGGLQTTVTARRRGRHVLPRPALRTEGPLGLGRRHKRDGEDEEIVVYPDMVAARTLAQAVRQGRFRDAGMKSRGPIGLGTDFERVRDYLPDDDIRQVNWRATARMGRPMSNQHRVETDRDVLFLVDCGRLSAAPIGDRTVLDATLDAVVAVALVADEMGDRCGVIAFDDKIRRELRPGRNGAKSVASAVFDLEPSNRESDYDLAFAVAAGFKRAFVLVLTDLIDTAAARPLAAAIPTLRRRHAITLAAPTDPGLRDRVRALPESERDVLTASAVVDLLDARAHAAQSLRAAGAPVVEASPKALAGACAQAYLRAKSRQRV